MLLGVVVCYSAMQCVGSALQSVAACFRVLRSEMLLMCVAIDTSVPTLVLQCVAVRCSVLQRVAVRCIVCCKALRSQMLLCVSIDASMPMPVLPCVAVRCRALQCVAVRCSALQCVAVRCFHICAQVSFHIYVGLFSDICRSLFVYMYVSFHIYVRLFSYICTSLFIYLPCFSMSDISSASLKCAAKTKMCKERLMYRQKRPILM